MISKKTDIDIGLERLRDGYNKLSIIKKQFFSTQLYALIFDARPLDIERAIKIYETYRQSLYTETSFFSCLVEFSNQPIIKALIILDNVNPGLKYSSLNLHLFYHNDPISFASKCAAVARCNYINEFSKTNIDEDWIKAGVPLMYIVRDHRYNGIVSSYIDAICDEAQLIQLTLQTIDNKNEALTLKLIDRFKNTHKPSPLLDHAIKAKQTQTMNKLISMGYRPQMALDELVIAISTCNNSEALLERILTNMSQTISQDALADTVIKLLNHTNLNYLTVILLSKITNINHQNEAGNTFLIIASQYNNIQIANMLIARNDINVNVKNRKGFTAYMVAKNHRHEAIASEIEKKTPEIGIEKWANEVGEIERRTADIQNNRYHSTVTVSLPRKKREPSLAESLGNFFVPTF